MCTDGVERPGESKMIAEEAGKYDAELERVAKIFKDAHYRGHVVMEYEEASFDNVPGAMDELRKFFDS